MQRKAHAQRKPCVAEARGGECGYLFQEISCWGFIFRRETTISNGIRSCCFLLSRFETFGENAAQVQPHSLIQCVICSMVFAFLAEGQPIQSSHRLPRSPTRAVAARSRSLSPELRAPSGSL